MDRDREDIKDTSEATGSKLWNEASEHFNYRIGDKDSFWGQVIQKKLNPERPDRRASVSPPSLHRSLRRRQNSRNPAKPEPKERASGSE